MHDGRRGPPTRYGARYLTSIFTSCWFSVVLPFQMADQHLTNIVFQNLSLNYAFQSSVTVAEFGLSVTELWLHVAELGKLWPMFWLLVRSTLYV